MFSSLPTLGVGLGFRTPFRAELFLQRDRVDFLEIMLDHYLAAPAEKARELDLLAAHYPLIPHGLNLSLGSADGVDLDYVRQCAPVIHKLNPPWWSEHLAFTHAGGVEIGHLAPLPFTWEAVEQTCHNLATVRRYVDRPFLLENVTYLVALPGADMTEAQFVAEVVERADCGLLLDVTNLYINSVNHGYDPLKFLDQIPLERVAQLHFVGGHEQAGVLMDSHSRPTPPEVWALMETVVARAPIKGIILERDEHIPPFDELAGELAHARELGRRYGRWA